MQVGTGFISDDVFTSERVSKANELLDKLAKGEGLNFTKNPTLEGFIDFEFNNMYDGCITPLFDTYGINNPCPNNEERRAIGKRIENEAE